MNLTELSTRQWPAVAVIVALAALFGGMAIANLPIQLLPTIEQPQINIANFWRAAAPEEMEATIIEPQESVLRNTPGLTDISSFVSRDSSPRCPEAVQVMTAARAATATSFSPSLLLPTSSSAPDHGFASFEART